MDFRILGPLEVSRDGLPLTLGDGRQSALLALLLVERNHTLGADRIVEELWNGDAPATAGKVVQNLVSQLRRLGADGVLHTRGHGYELTVPDEALDAARFERRLSEGRDALARGDPARARALLGEALGMWRGPAFGDYAEAPWARAEASRLEDRRMVALERRVDADLALGRHADVIGELEAAIAHEPLREAPRRQLMLALYRSGRQAEALAAYQDARRTLVGELGIEPGPELAALHTAILAHDPALAAPEDQARDARRRTRGGALALAGGAALVLAAVAATLLIARNTGEGAAVRSGGGAVVALDARTGKVTERIDAGRTPSTMAAGGGDLWMVDSEARTLVRIDQSSGDAESLGTGATPTDVTVAAGAVWVANGRERPGSPTLGAEPDAIVRVDPATHRQHSAPLPITRIAQETSAEQRVAASGGAVWALGADGSVSRVDPATAAVTHVARGVHASAIAAGGAGLWATREDGSLLELDGSTGAVRRRIRLPIAHDGVIAVGDDAAFVVGWNDGKLYRVTRTGGVGAVAVSEGVTDLAVAGRVVWAVSPVSGSVTAVDAPSMRVVHTLQIDGEPRSLAVDGDTVWVGITRPADALSEEVAGVRPLPASRCEPVVAGNGGRADVLVVSDLPLQGDNRLSAVQMAQAITFVLREHRFRAGRFRIAYQSCDDAVAGGGLFDEAKCAANGRAYGRDRDVVGVIGSFHSGCAARVIPELNRAPGGPVAMVSPLNSYVGLTRSAEIPGLLATLYPTGRRNFVRVYPTDELQSGALARFARDRGDRRMFVLDDGYAGYSVLVADAFERASKRLGLGVVGRERFDPSDRAFRRLVDRVAAAHPDGVFIGALTSPSTGALIRALRGRLGRDVDLLGPDGLSPAQTLERMTGPAARGVFFSRSEIAPGRLPPAGAGFVTRFARTQAGVEIEPYAVYAAQATEVMLDAIARSDGTRASVLDRVFRTRLRGSLIGDVAFDTRGDTPTARVTVLRVVGGAPDAGSIATLQGAAIERVDTVSQALIAR